MPGVALAPGVEVNQREVRPGRHGFRIQLHQTPCKGERLIKSPLRGQ